jgi:anti-sigma regulatory factor (Ser/Thr protein kinase)
MPHGFAATYEATPASVSLVRNRLASLARDCGLAEREVGDVRLAVSEAATNALVHGARERGANATITVEAQVGGGELVIGIGDDGPGMRPRPDSPGLGLGLPLIASVARRMEILEGRPGTHVRMVFGCPKAV